MKPTRLRLLPWPAQDGRQAFTPDDCPNGRIARLADRMEADQLRSANFVEGVAREMLELSLDRELTVPECTYVMMRLCESLSDVIRVAESRGYRLPLPEFESESEGEAPEDPDGAGD